MSTPDATPPDLDAVAEQRHSHEPHSDALASRLNWLRAGVLGANDGTISTAGLVIGVAAATTDTGQIATAGIAGLVAGAVSMALGEYVSVSTQRDTERAMIDLERHELAASPDDERNELIGLLRQRGLSDESSTTVADELTRRDPLRAHLDIELGIDADDLANPWAAAGASAVAFSVGAALPLAAILIPPASLRIAVTFVAVLLGLLLTGMLSAHLGGSSKSTAGVRLVAGGAAAWPSPSASADSSEQRLADPPADVARPASNGIRVGVPLARRLACVIGLCCLGRSASMLR